MPRSRGRETAAAGRAAARSRRWRSTSTARRSRRSRGEMRAIDRKLGRELWRMKGQMMSIAMVVATGIMTVLTMRGGHDSLAVAQADYYADTRFADVWVSLKRAPETVADEVARLPGVAEVDTRVTALARLDLPDVEGLGMGRFVSVPRDGRPRLNDVVLVRGRWLAPGARDEVLVNGKFAEARSLEPGDSVRAILNGRLRTLDVAGIANSPEHSYAVPPGADPEHVIAEVDRVVDRYGGRGAYPRDDQLSHSVLQSELDQNRVMSTAIPAVFLLVAAFLLHLVLGRMIATQRTEIAVLKAFGYRDAEVGRHYLAFALAAIGLGAALGTIGGAWLGEAYVDLYGAFFVFPELEFLLRPYLLLAAAGVSALAAGLGAMGAVRSAVELPPAEAMRPEPPPTFEPGPLERAGVGRILPSAGRLILRNIERR